MINCDFPTPSKRNKKGSTSQKYICKYKKPFNLRLQSCISAPLAFPFFFVLRVSWNQPPAKNNYNETCIKLVRAGLSVGADDRKKAGEQQKASERKTAAKNHFPSFHEMKIRASWGYVLNSKSATREPIWLKFGQLTGCQIVFLKHRLCEFWFLFSFRLEVFFHR